MSFIMAFGWIPIIIFSFLFLYLLFEISCDRNNEGSNMWGVLIGSIALYIILNWNDISVKETLTVLFSKDTLFTFLKYAGVGIIYSMIEFRLVVKEAAEYFAKAMKHSEHVSMYLFVNAIRCKGDDGVPYIKPIISKQQLARNISVWTLFWPFYLLNMIFGKFLYNIFNYIADFFVTYTKKYVTKVFADAFKDFDKS